MLRECLMNFIAYLGLVAVLVLAMYAITEAQVGCDPVTLEGCGILTPSEPTTAEPPPPLLCPDGSISSCNPVSDASCVPCGGNVGDSDASELFFEIYPDSGLFNQFNSHIEAEQNYYACQTNNTQLYQVFGVVAPLVCNGPKISDFIDAVFACNRPVIQCDEMASFSGGNLYKPVSENSGNPVILVGAQYANGACQALNNQGAAVSSCSARPTNGSVNGGRAHFDINSRCSSLPPYVFRVVKDGRSTCWPVSSPCSRME